MSNSISNARSLFPALTQKVHGHNLVYLDSAATTLKPKQVIDRIQKHYSFETANVHRGIHYLSATATQMYEQTRETLSQFINSRFHEEIIFTKGTTDSINLLANTYGQTNLKKDDVILVSTMEHHSNIVPWQMIAQKTGAKVIEVPITDQGEINLESFETLLNDRVKIVSFCHVSNALGTINPIEKMVKTVREKTNAVFVLDAAQSAAHLPVDVQALDIDFLALSAHKIYGPTGVGILYGKKELLEKLPPYQGGGAMIKEVSFEGTTYNDLPEIFEAGTPHIAGVISFKESIDFINQYSWNEIKNHEDELLKLTLKELSKIDRLKLIGQAENRSGAISFVVDGAHPHDLGMILDEQGVAIRTGHHCTQPLMKRFSVPATARVSFGIYNNEEDVSKFIQSLKKAMELL